MSKELNLTQEEVDDLRASFEMFDCDKSGEFNLCGMGWYGCAQNTHGIVLLSRTRTVDQS